MMPVPPRVIVTDFSDGIPTETLIGPFVSCVVRAFRSLDASVTGDGVIHYEATHAGLATSVTGGGAIIPS